MIRVEFDRDGYYPIFISIPQNGLTITEAKELVEKLQAEIEIAEWQAQKDKEQAQWEKRVEEADITGWDEKTETANHWSQDYLESFNEDGLSMD